MARSRCAAGESLLLSHSNHSKVLDHPLPVDLHQSALVREALRIHLALHAIVPRQLIEVLKELVVTPRHDTPIHFQVNSNGHRHWLLGQVRTSAQLQCVECYRVVIQVSQQFHRQCENQSHVYLVLICMDSHEQL